MPHRLRKTRKLRGSRTHGYGIVGQHRKHSQKGGRGKAGGHKHLWTRVVKYEPERFRKIGFRPRAKLKEARVINVGQLDEIASRAKSRVAKPTIDLDRLGYNKLLGRGRILRPYVVRVSSFSKSAKEKVEGAGGEIVKPS